MKRIVLVLFLSANFATMSACAGRTAAWDAKVQRPSRDLTLMDEAVLLRSEGDAFWRERARAEQVKDAIVRWEQAVAIDPEDHETWTKISRAYATMAREHLKEGEAPIQATEAGLHAAETALMVVSPDFGERMQRGASLTENLGVVGKEAAGSLYWYALNLEAWLPHQSRLVRMRHRDDVTLAIARVLEIDEGYFHGAAHRFAALEALREEERMDEARGHLERAIELSPSYLPNRLLLAEKIAVPTLDRDLFEEHIAYILAAEDDVLPEHVYESLEVKTRAREVFARADSILPRRPVEEADDAEVPADDAETASADGLIGDETSEIDPPSADNGEEKPKDAAGRGDDARDGEDEGEATSEEPGHEDDTESAVAPISIDE